MPSYCLWNRRFGTNVVLGCIWVDDPVVIVRMLLEVQWKRILLDAVRRVPLYHVQ